MTTLLRPPSTTNWLPIQAIPANSQTANSLQSGWWKGLTKNTSFDVFLAVGMLVFDCILATSDKFIFNHAYRQLVLGCFLTAWYVSFLLPYVIQCVQSCDAGLLHKNAKILFLGLDNGRWVGFLQSLLPPDSTTVHGNLTPHALSSTLLSRYYVHATKQMGNRNLRMYAFVLFKIDLQY